MNERGVNGLLSFAIAVPLVGGSGFATYVLGWLTWRWARCLPPGPSLAMTDEERDEIS